MGTHHSYSDASILAMARDAGHLLENLNLKLATAESCTGGWLAKANTDLAGSSAWFERGFVTYSNDAKRELLGVSEETLDRYGAVSQQTALEMTEGALRNSRGDFAIAVTGVAGPDGGSADKPVGTVWIAWQRRGAQAGVAHYRFDGDRERVRRASVVAALEGVLRLRG